MSSRWGTCRTGPQGSRGGGGPGAVCSGRHPPRRPWRGCGPSADAPTATAGRKATAATGKPATITVTPADGTRRAGCPSPVEVGVGPGTLASVQVIGNDGSTLAGTFDAVRTRQRGPSRV
ncbi:hypothetical protein ACWGLF_30530 [Streptomyces puniciscabiei]